MYTVLHPGVDPVGGKGANAAPLNKNNEVRASFRPFAARTPPRTPLGDLKALPETP